MQLTFVERAKICMYVKLGPKQILIAKKLKPAPKTVSRYYTSKI